MAVAVLKRSRTPTYDLVADLVPIDTAAPADVAIIPTTSEMQTRGYRITGFYVYNATATPVLAQLSLRNAAAGLGDAIVAAAVLTALTDGAQILPMTIAIGAKQTAANLYANLTVANAAAATVSVKILYELL